MLNDERIELETSSPLRIPVVHHQMTLSPPESQRSQTWFPTWDFETALSDTPGTLIRWVGKLQVLDDPFAAILTSALVIPASWSQGAMNKKKISFRPPVISSYLNLE